MAKKKEIRVSDLVDSSQVIDHVSVVKKRDDKIIGSESRNGRGILQLRIRELMGQLLGL